MSKKRPQAKTHKQLEKDIAVVKPSAKSTKGDRKTKIATSKTPESSPVPDSPAISHVAKKTKVKAVEDDSELVSLPSPTVPYDEKSNDDSISDDEEEFLRQMMEAGELDFLGEEGFDFFNFGEGEDFAFGDDELIDDDDDDEDDEGGRSENDDLDELISLHAQSAPQPKKKAKASKTKAKKAAIPDDDDDGDDDDEDSNGEIQASFGFFDPDETKDWHSVKKFVSTLIDKKNFDAHNLADIIVGQPHVGMCPWSVSSLVSHYLSLTLSLSL